MIILISISLNVYVLFLNSLIILCATNQFIPAGRYRCRVASFGTSRPNAEGFEARLAIHTLLHRPAFVCSHIFRVRFVMGYFGIEVQVLPNELPN
jgi:hypothetical protein